MPEADQVDGFMRRFYLVIFLAAISVILPVLGLAYYLDSRLDSFETDLTYRPPDVEDNAAEELDELPWVATQGQVIYVPAYSHIYHQSGRPQLLTVTLSARNTDSDNEIVLTAVRYYNTDGQMVRSYVDQPLRVGPLATTEFVVERDDKVGGSGANFIVEWASRQPVTDPIIEAVMIGTSGTQGISFVCEGTVVRENSPAEQ